MERQGGKKQVRRTATVGITALLLAGFVLISVSARPDQTDELMPRLLAERRYFELQRLLASETGPARPETLFFRGILANALNRPEDSVGYLTAYLQTSKPGRPGTRIREALGTLADDYTKLFQYRKASETRERIAPGLQKELTPSDYAAFLSVIDFGNALASAPPQTVDIPGDTETPLTEFSEIPAAFEDREIFLLTDTGSALSLIIQSDAKRLGFRILDVEVQVGTSTGESVKARPCLVPEFRIGAIRVFNAVFLVVPDKMFFSRELMRQRSGLLGFPVLNALREITFSPRGTFTVSSPPRVTGPPNFFLERHNPVLEASFRGRRLLFLFDTGAYQSELFPSFYRAFRTEIEAKGTYAPEDIEGVGTHVTVPVYLMKGLSFDIGAQDVVFDKELPILTKSTNEASDVYDGTLSLDLMDAKHPLTISYAAMQIVLH
jgi:hypothetical protein